MTAAIALLVVPYDSAQLGERMGAGPHALLGAGLKERLSREGLEVAVLELEPENAFRAEVATAFELHKIVRDAVEAAVARDCLPIALTGNCNSGVVGSLVAHHADDVGLIWFDAHSDAETPETSTSGFFDGMGFAVALGECWKPKLDELGWPGLDGARASLIGAREISAAAGGLLERRGVSIVSPEAARSGSAADALGPALARMTAAGVKRVHVHVDLDVLDPDLVGPANSYALPFGLSVKQLMDHIRLILAEFPLASASVASYDPSFDTEGAVSSAGLEIISLLARANDRVAQPA
jgi:arginase